MNRDQVEIPIVVEKCCAAIEKYGLRSQGIYRISGTQTKVVKLKERLDKGSSMRVVDLRNANLSYVQRRGGGGFGCGRMGIRHQQRCECCEALAKGTSRPSFHVQSSSRLH